MIEVDALQPQQMVEVCAIAEEFHRKSNFSDMPFEPEVMMVNLAACWSRPHRRACWVATENGKIGGAILVNIEQTFFGSGLTACDMGLYVRPQNRSFRAVRLLISNYIKWAKENGAMRINLINCAGVDAEVASRVLQRLGFVRVGDSMVYGG